MKTLEQISEGKDFEPHMMYDPKTGKGYKAEKPEDHERMKKMGYSHEKPEVKEAKGDRPTPYQVNVRGKGGVSVKAKDMDDAKEKAFKELGIDSKLLKDKSFMRKVKVSSKYNEVKEAKDTFVVYKSSGIGKIKKLATINSMPKGKMLDKVLDKYNADGVMAMSKITRNKVRVHEEILETENDMLQENYRTLARKGMGTETKKDARVGLEIDFYETERGDKVFGKIIKVTGTGYTVQAMERGNSKKYTFKFHDRAKAKKLLEMVDFMENYRAKRDAMRDMPKRGKDSADDDIEANDDDRKAASKNVLMQIRKASDLPKGGSIEFEGGKKGKISQDDAKKISKLFDMLKKPQDKQKFQKVISKDLRSIQGLLKRLGR